MVLAINETADAMREQQAEKIALQPMSLNQNYQLALLFASPFRSSRAAGVAAFIEISMPTLAGDEQDSEFEEAYSQYIADSGRQENSRDMQGRESDGAGFARDFVDAMEGLRSGEAGRAAVMYLAQAANAQLAESLGLDAGY